MRRVTKPGDRSQFLELEHRAYLAHAAVSPPPFAARVAVASLLDAYARKGAAVFGLAIEQRARVKRQIATLIGADADEIALAPSTTAGVREVALAFPWNRGDRVVLFEGEFPANVTPWQRAAETFGLEVDVVPTGAFLRSEAEGLSALDGALRDRTRLVAVSAVQFQTGLRMPLRAIGERAHAVGAELFVDGIQSVGAIPIDVRAEQVDYLACGGHKWLMGLEGAGFLFVRRDRAERLVPRGAGWLSHEHALDFLFLGEGHLRRDRPFKRTADVLEIGAVSAIGYAALEASLGLLLEVTPTATFAHVQSYFDRLEPPLIERGFTSFRVAHGRSCILACKRAGHDMVKLHRSLGERGIACSVPDGYLRFAPHFGNSMAEIPEVLDAIDQSIAVNE